jgi:hypothetical protein
MAIQVLDASLNPQTIETLPSVGRKSAATSLPMAASNEDKAVADAMAASLVSILAKLSADPATQTTLAAILAKLPAVGTAGSAASNVLTVQGIASGTAQPVSLSSLPSLAAGANAIGSITNTGFVSTGNVAHDAADSGNPVKIGGKANDAAPTQVANGDRADLAVDRYGHVKTVAVDSTGAIIDPSGTVNVAQDTSVIKNGSASLTPKFATISSTGSGDTVALVATKKIRVLSLFLLVAGATTVKFQSGASTDKTGAMAFPANGGISLPFNPAGHFETAAGEKLNHVLGSSVAIAGALTYVEV